MLGAIRKVLSYTMVGTLIPLIGALVWHYVMMPVLSPPKFGEGIDGIGLALIVIGVPIGAVMGACCGIAVVVSQKLTESSRPSGILFIAQKPHVADEPPVEFGLEMRRTGG